MITFTAPAAAAAIRAALHITNQNVRILITDNTRTVYSDYTGFPADVEVCVYAPDHYDNAHVENADTLAAIENLTDGVDIDTIEVTVTRALADTLLTTQAAA